MNFQQLQSWFVRYLQGGRCPASQLEGRVVFLLDSTTECRRICTVLSRKGVSIDGAEPRDFPKLTISGRLEDWGLYLQTAKAEHLAKLSFRGDARLWTTFVQVAQRVQSPLALRCSLAQT